MFLPLQSPMAKDRLDHSLARGDGRHQSDEEKKSPRSRSILSQFSCFSLDPTKKM